MLSNRAVLTLAIITAITAVAAVTAQYTHWSNTIRTVASEPAFPNIGEALSKVARIKMERSPNNKFGSFTFSRLDKPWIMDSKGGYPATETVIRELLVAFTELELVEAKTRNPARFNKLNLRHPNQKGSKASRIILEDAKGNVLLDALFGKRVPSLSGGTPSVYMRRTNEDQTWLATGELEVRAGAMEWLPTDIVSITRERIKRTTLKAPDQKPLELYYDDVHKRFEIVDLPENLEISSRYRLLQVGILQERLRLEDVRPSEGLIKDLTLGGAIWQTKDGLTVTLDLASAPNASGKKRVWALISVDVIADAEGKVLKEAEEIRARTQGWAYWLGKPAMQKIWAARSELTQEK